MQVGAKELLQIQKAYKIRSDFALSLQMVQDFGMSQYFGTPKLVDFLLIVFTTKEGTNSH